MTNEEMLSQIDHKVDELLQWRSALDERCTSHRELTNEVRRTVYGNPGKANGLQFTVSRLNSGRKFWSYILRGLILATIIAGGSGIVTLLTLYLKG